MRCGSLEAFAHYLQQKSNELQGGVYYLIGESAQVARQLFGESGVQVLDGREVSCRQLAEELESGSLFGGCKGVHCRHADQLNAAAKKWLGEYCARPNRSVCVLLEGKKEASLERIVGTHGFVIDLLGAPPWEREKQLVSWLEGEAHARGYAMEQAATQCLLDFCGENRALLGSELEKLMCYVGEAGRIGRADVEAIGVRSAHAHAWALGQLVLERNVAGALALLRRLLCNKEPTPHAILAQLRSQMDTAFQVASAHQWIAEQGGAQGDLARMFPQWTRRRLEREVPRARRYGVANYKKAVAVLADAELRSKSGTTQMPFLLEMVVARLAT